MKSTLLLLLLPAAVYSQTAPPVTYLLDSSWQTGLQAEITIANPGSARINNWTLKFTYPYAISSIWNAVIASHTGNVYTITGASWDTSIAAQSSVNFGWIASNNGQASGPSACYLDNLAISSASCPSSGSAPDTTPPTIPANLASPSQTTSTIALTWSPSTDSGSGVAGYIVWENGIQLGNVTSTSFTAAGLAQNTAYTFAV